MTGAPATKMKTASDKPLHGSRILVVEDEALVAFAIMGALTVAGAEVWGPAASLAHALEFANAEHFDCAVLDVMLHGGLVFPAASILKQRGAGIVFHTGYHDLEGIKRDWPGAQVLCKPAPPQLLLRAVKAACSR